jgi:hypothetical protein
VVPHVVLGCERQRIHFHFEKVHNRFASMGLDGVKSCSSGLVVACYFKPRGSVQQFDHRAGDLEVQTHALHRHVTQPSGQQLDGRDALGGTWKMHEAESAISLSDLQQKHEIHQMEDMKKGTYIIDLKLLDCDVHHFTGSVSGH